MCTRTIYVFFFFLGICVYSSQRASTCMYEVVGAPDWLEGVWYTHIYIYERCLERVW